MFKVLVPGEDLGGSFFSPSGNAGIAVRSVAHNRQVIGNRFRVHAELRGHSRFIAENLTSTIELNDSGTDDALSEILVWRANDDLLDAFVLGRLRGRGRESIIRLEVGHRPDKYSHSLQGFLENRKLRKQFLRYALTGFVSGIQLIAEGLYYMISGDSDMCGASFDHGQNGTEHAANRPNFLPALIGR